MDRAADGIIKYIYLIKNFLLASGLGFLNIKYIFDESKIFFMMNLVIIFTLAATLYEMTIEFIKNKH